MALDDKLYRRDLEVALALSVKEVPAVTIDVEQSQGKRNLSSVIISETFWKVKMKSVSCAWLFATLWTIAYQAPPSMGFSRQECWSGLLFPSPADFPNPGIEPGSLALEADTNLWATREAPKPSYPFCNHFSGWACTGGRMYF